MRFLFCCEFYSPSVGGVQEVMRQVAEHLVARGHQVTIATTRLIDRDFPELNGVRIEEFAITGRNVGGIIGESAEIERYRRFVCEFPGDALLIKAAQQWTFDALWPVLDRIRMRKVFIPCGFSGLYKDDFSQYYKELPGILDRFDHLIFYAQRYRDIDFARAHGLNRFSVIPNGASENEFGSLDPDPDLRHRLGIGADDLVLMTVGSLTGTKGHRETVEAFARMDTRGRKATLVLNGNRPHPPAIGNATAAVSPMAARVPPIPLRVWRVLRREGWQGVTDRLERLRYGDPIALWTRRANAQPLKRVLQTDLPRPDLVALFKEADLFVFASNIEYSPLVLYEAAAAGTPFLSVPVGNAEEIAAWTGAGLICPAPVDEQGLTHVKPATLASALEQAMADPRRLAALGTMGHQRWEQHFNWATITGHYETILNGGTVTSLAFPRMDSGGIAG